MWRKILREVVGPVTLVLMIGAGYFATYRYRGIDDTGVMRSGSFHRPLWRPPWGVVAIPGLHSIEFEIEAKPLALRFSVILVSAAAVLLVAGRGNDPTPRFDSDRERFDS